MCRKDIFLAVDECFLELSEGWSDSLIGFVKEHRKLFILRAFTKDYAMPVCGWGTASAETVCCSRRCAASRSPGACPYPLRRRVSPRAQRPRFLHAAGNSSGMSEEADGLFARTWP